MKVYLPAIEGHVPVIMVRAVHNLIEFSYLVRTVRYSEPLRLLSILTIHANIC